MPFHAPQAIDSLPGYHPVARRYAWTVFAILMALMICDYVSRQVVVSMFSHLKAQWDLSDRQLGALVSIVSVTVAIGAVPVSLLADRWSRVKSIFLMALIWSLATVACALATSYAQLLAGRAIVGMGEAGYGTVGVALLATLFPPRMRSTILGIFLAAGMLGSVLGVVLGGVIAEHWGWKTAFASVGVPGLVISMLFLLVARDDRTVALPTAAAPDRRHHANVARLVKELVRPRSAVFTCLGAGLQLLAASTIWAWMPSYLNRAYGLAADQAGAKAALVVLAGGVGAVFWSTVADRLSVRHRVARLYVPAAAGIATAALLTPALHFLPAGGEQFVLLVAGGFMMAGTIGPAAAVVMDVTHPGLRATAAAGLALTQNLLGLASGPLLTGMLSDRYGLQTAMATAPLFCLLAAGMFLLASRSYQSDARRTADADNAIAPTLQPQHA